MTNSAERPDREVLAELLLRWEDLYERGQDTPPAELAKDHPGLVGELGRRIAALKSLAWIRKPPPDLPAGAGPIPTTRAAGVRLGGRYRLESLVAEGGFAEVYRAFDEELQRTVAIKVPKPGRLDSSDAFLAEARRIARLEHESIVPVYDVGVEGDTCFIVTEFLEGGSLADRLADSPLPLTDAVRWIAEVAEALEHAHLHGVVHRDVKPGNVLIDRRGRAKLADFGIAQSAAKSADNGPSLGTLRYMSPEQLAGKPSDHRSDIYSLGVVLHEALTGAVPYPSVEPQSLRRDILAGKPLLSARLPARFRAVCGKALSQDARERQASAGQFAAELRRAGGAAGGHAWVAPLVAIVLVSAGLFVTSQWLSKQAPGVTAPATLSSEEVLAEATNRFFQRDFAEAETLFTTYLDRKPDDLEALTRRGLCRTGRGAFASGVQDFTKAIAIKPDDATLHKQRAMAFASLRQFGPAIDDYQAAITLDPGDRETRESFGACYSIMAAEKAEAEEFTEAADLMTKALSVYPQSAVFWHQRGSCYFHSGEYEKALTDLDEAIRMEPRKPEHYENRGHCYQRLGRGEEADREFKKAEELRKQ
jgi:serine/threonine protein kinase